MIRAIHTLACSALAATALAACAFSGATSLAANENSLQAAHSSSRPIYLRAMTTQLATPRSAVGVRYTGTHCTPTGEVIWDDELFRRVSRQLPKIFRRDSQRAHYRVPPDGTSDIHMTAGNSINSEYMEIDMQVQEVNVRLCTQDQGASGSASMKVLWQVYAAGESTPVYETVTQGNYDAPVIESSGSADFFAHAFSDALQNMLAKQGFRDAVTPGAPR